MHGRLGRSHRGLDAVDVVEPIAPVGGPRQAVDRLHEAAAVAGGYSRGPLEHPDRKSTRLNSSHDQISYAVFCLKKKKKKKQRAHAVIRTNTVMYMCNCCTTVDTHQS